MLGSDPYPFWLDKRSRDGGLSTAGMVIALLVTLSLVFTGAQVYRVQSAAADVQEVADAAALAADNVVAEYYLIARVCDAVVLSLALTGIITMGVGVAALCTPVSASMGAKLIEMGERVLKARDAFAKRAQAGLDKLQKAIPFLSAVAAYRVAAANQNGMGSGYIGFAMVFPFEGKDVAAGESGQSDALIDAVDDAADKLEQAGEEAEKAAKDAKLAKEKAYEADCGANPAFCMYERAASLAHLHGAQNPYFSSVDTWGFSVALDRAKAYYPLRLAQEAPLGESVDEQANSALRKRFYAYAVDVVGSGYVHESDGSFDADFPLLPKNTAELRGTRLFSESVYPITVNGEGSFEMHAWAGCPRASSVVGTGSLAQREAGDFSVCPACDFTASSLGKVAAASSTIQNGFEYHYRIVAEQAEAYEKARQAYQPKARKVRQIAGALFENAVSALKKMANQRIEVAPPGRFGIVSVVAATDSKSADWGFASGFVRSAGELGPCAAISGATLVNDSPEQGKTILASALDGIRQRSGSPLVGALDGVMDVWSAVLFAYAEGQSRIGEGLDKLKGKLSFLSESGLGIWGSKEFSEMMQSLGLQPARLDAPKPALVNTGHVLEADEGAFAARLLSVKRAASGLTGNNLFEWIVDAGESQALAEIAGFDGKVTIAEIEILGEGMPAIPLTITIPSSWKEEASGVVSSIAENLRGVVGSIVGTRQWR